MDISERTPPVSQQPWFHMRQEGLQRRELGDVAGERVEEPDGGVAVPLEEEDAVDGVEDAVVTEEREPGADEGAGREVEEADARTRRACRGPGGGRGPRGSASTAAGGSAGRRCRGRAVRAGGAGPPVGARRAEADVVPQIAGEHSPPD